MQNLRGQAESAAAAAFAPPRLNSRGRKPARAGLEILVKTETRSQLARAHPPAQLSRRSAATSKTLRAAFPAPDGEPAQNVFGRTAVVAESQSGLMLERLAPAARRLGSLGEEDSCNFFDVTRALDLLRGLLASLRWADPPPRAPAMLLLIAAGEPHRFRRKGRRVERGDARQLVRLSERGFDALGISCACERFRDALPPFLAEARSRAKPHTAIVLGSALFSAYPDLICELGADFAAPGLDSPRRVSLALLEPAHL